jgi:hypothetical protein
MADFILAKESVTYVCLDVIDCSLSTKRTSPRRQRRRERPMKCHNKAVRCRLSQAGSPLTAASLTSVDATDEGTSTVFKRHLARSATFWRVLDIVASLRRCVDRAPAVRVCRLHAVA